MKSLKALFLTAAMIITLPHVLKAENDAKDVSFEFAQKFQLLVDDCGKRSEDDIWRDFTVLVGPSKARDFLKVYGLQRATVDAKAVAYYKPNELGCRRLKSMMSSINQQIKSAARQSEYCDNATLIDMLGSNIFEIIKHERRQI